MRQFGHGQRIPQDTEPAAHVEELLGLDFRAPVHDWGARYLEYLRLWEQRDQHIAEGEVRADPLSHHFHDEYDEWYRRRTRLALSHDSAQFQGMIASLEQATILSGTGDSHMSHVLRSGLARSGAYEQLPDRGPHRPRAASRLPTYPPYHGYPIPQRGHSTGLDDVDYGSIVHSDVGYAFPPYYVCNEDFANGWTYSFDDPPQYQSTAPQYQSTTPHYQHPVPQFQHSGRGHPDASSGQPYEPTSQPVDQSHLVGSQGFSDDSRFKDWAQRPDLVPQATQTPPYTHTLRDRTTLRPPYCYTDEQRQRRQRGRRH
ncbi:hypothetical protein LINPERPRIM_LOCUS37703 [Linum perenne]